MSMFLPPAGEVDFYLPGSSSPFYSLGVWSERLRSWVPLLFTGNREAAAGQAARLSEGGFTYWCIPFDHDDEAAELAEWRRVPPPDTVEFRDFLGMLIGAHEPGDPNS